MQSFYNTLESSDDDDESSQNEDDELEAKVFLKHIRKAFISIDETSYCEMGILPDLKVFDKRTPENFFTLKKPILDDQLKAFLSKRIDAGSYEYARLPKNKSNKKYASGISASNNTFKNSNYESEFKEDDEETNDQSNEKLERDKIVPYKFEPKLYPNEFKNLVSPLTQLLQNEECEENDFAEYLKFEATQETNYSQKLRIFLPKCDDEKAKEKASMIIRVYKNARISDLIGLICCKYINEKRKPTLKFKNVSYYYLKIADDTGEIEDELSPLDASTLVGRFGFNDLALIEKEDTGLTSTNDSMNVIVKINFTDGSHSKLFAYDMNYIPMSKVYDDVYKYKMENSTSLFIPTIAYKMEHIDEAGIAIDLKNTYLNSFQTYEFYFFRDKSLRRLSSPESSITLLNLVENNTDLTKTIKESNEYKVLYLSKWRKVNFKMELSKDNLELEEIKHVQLTQLRLKSKRSNFYTIPMNNIVSCTDLKDHKIPGKSQIRIIAADDEHDDMKIVYKHLDFECDADLVEEIKTSFSHLITFCNSPYMEQYNANKEKVKTTKWSRTKYKITKNNSLSNTSHQI